MQTGSKENRRKSRWIPRSIQGKIGVTAFSAAAVVLLLSLQFGMIGLYWIYKQSPQSAEEALQLAKQSLLVEFLILGVLTAFVAVWGARTFFRYAGPIFRVREYLSAIPGGRWDTPCKIRDDDQLQDLNAALNGALAEMVNRVRSQYEVLAEAREVISGLPNVEPLLEKMDAEASEFRRRLGAETPEAAKPETVLA